MRSSIMIVTSESDKVYEFIAARMILIVEIMCVGYRTENYAAGTTV